MRKAASSEELKQCFEQHLEETRGQAERLEQVFELLDLTKRTKRCEAMEGLIAEGQDVIEEVEDPDVRDAGLIVAAQKIEHYEISGYGSLATMAKQFGYKDAGKLLEETLTQETITSQKLIQLALYWANKKARQNDK